ncbi:MAG: peptidylprolyl isomerase [Saprospiraceae bacterium]|nr:peptidylprolyl isomerase [Saprospiraceae bacterium]
MHKSIILIFVAGLLLTTCQPKERHLLIETELGNMEVLLYNSTPKHRDNMIKLVEEGYYDGLLFHRIIKDFMIQGGDPDSRNASPQQMLGQGGPGYQIDAEIGALHFKGALSAARMADQVNPQRKSSGSQFFIVQGYKVQDQELDRWESEKGIKYTPEQRKLYREVGGYPFLDNDYTVFGEVVEGLEVIDKIATVQVGQADRPVKDLTMKISLL